MLVAFVSISCNILCSLTLPALLGHAGLALATAIAAWVNMAILLAILFRRGQYRWDKRVASRVPRIVLASLAMGAALVVARHFAQPIFNAAPHGWLRILTLSGILSAGLLTYGICCHLFGALKWQEARNALARR
jgi:putative peptidoglycan lipid II flippase